MLGWIYGFDPYTVSAVEATKFTKGSSSGVLGNTQLELSGVEHLRRRNLYGQHLVGKSLEHRIPSIERLAEEMIDHWDKLAMEGSEFVHDKDGKRIIELG